MAIQWRVVNALFVAARMLASSNLSNSGGSAWDGRVTMWKSDIPYHSLQDGVNFRLTCESYVSLNYSRYYGHGAKTFQYTLVN